MKSLFRIIFLCYTLMRFSNALVNLKILAEQPKDTWISREKFEQMIQVSLVTSKCTNIQFSGSSKGIEQLLDRFVSIYQQYYTIDDPTYGCKGHLVISTSIESLTKMIKSIPTVIYSTEILVIIDDRVEPNETTKLLNVSMYANARVNVVAMNGLWCLSENYLHPRKFRKVGRYDELMGNVGMINMHGRPLTASTVYNPPLCYLRSSVNRTIDGVETTFFTAENESELDGIELKIFLLITERLNSTWSIRTPNDGYRFGRRNDSAWFGGIIGQLYRKQVDFAFAGIWLEIGPATVANLTQPWSQVDVRFAVPRPKPSRSFWALKKPFSPTVWATALAMLVAQSTYIWGAAWINPNIPKKYQSFTVTWTECIARLLGMSGSGNVRGLQLHFQLWYLIGVLLVTAYSSSLAARLSSYNFEERIDTTEQFIKANLTWGREGQPPRYAFFGGDLDRWANQFPLHFKSEKNQVERHEKIVKGNYAIIGRVVGRAFFPDNYVSDEDLDNYRIMRDSMGNFYTTFAVQPWLLESVNEIMLHLAEGGLIDYHLWHVLDRHSSTAYREVLIERDNNLEEEARVLELAPLGAGFTLFAVGVAISSCVFYFELKSIQRKKNWPILGRNKTGPSRRSNAARGQRKIPRKTQFILQG